MQCTCGICLNQAKHSLKANMPIYVSQITPMDGVNPSHQAQASTPYAQIKTKCSRKPQPRVSSDKAPTPPVPSDIPIACPPHPSEPNESKR
ncbi:hypothetical protein BDV33DRAFT_92901 [Aspergillus novoparasiticus]|uniref:Uncharacterized protein n=1 Tax=Aspergillus novoparasiticus TaxID=986946 RepID=A0A5N6ESM5_9EURO|nr:hypothetical protein BDV33DRAFT_92901 [Aspergillus novoparasiticus]